MTAYLVRQYRPNYFSGFDNQVVTVASRDDIVNVPWHDNFKNGKLFDKFVIEEYYGELIVSAHYKDGKHWVSSFALPVDSSLKAPDGGLMRDNWRYKQPENNNA